MKYFVVAVSSMLLLISCANNSNDTNKTTDTLPPTVNDTAVKTSVYGPDTSVKITEAYARLVARDAYFWAWPMMNIYNRRLAFKQAPEAGLMNGVLPFAPLNSLSMLHDYVEPQERWVACPNRHQFLNKSILFDLNRTRKSKK